MYRSVYVDEFVEVINSGLDFLYERTRFSMTEYPDKLSDDALVEILNIMVYVGYKGREEYTVKSIATYIEFYYSHDCKFIHDGHHIDIIVPEINTRRLADSTLSNKIVNETTSMILYLYACSTDKIPARGALQMYINNNNCAGGNNYYTKLPDPYLYEYLKYIYTMYTHDNHIWNKNTCMKFLGFEI